MNPLSRDLLLQAEDLAKRDVHRPRQGNLRRSVSASYYALFHFLIDEACQRLAGAGAGRVNLRKLLARAFDHGKMRAVCQEFSKTTTTDLLKPFWTTHGLPDNDLTKVCSAFVELQKRRHEADYDLSLSLTRQEALDENQRAKEAVAA